MSITILISYAISIALLISSPGPNVLLVIKNSEQGFKSAIPVIAGGSLSALILITVALIGINFVWSFHSLYFEIGKIIGGLYLLWLGYKSYREKSQPYDFKKTKGSFWIAFIAGISNPKDIIFFLAFLSNFLILSESIILQSAYLIGIWFMVDLTIMTFYAEFAKQLFKLSLFRLVIHQLSSFILIILGLATIILSAHSFITSSVIF